MNLNLLEFKDKISLAKELFTPFFKGEFECFASPLKHFRTRAELSFYHDEKNLNYAMFDKNTKKKYCLESLEFADIKINDLMKRLLKPLNENTNLKEKLFGVEFLATKKELSVTLLYHKNVDLISKDLANLSKNLNLNLIARSRGKKLVFGKENLLQELEILGDFFFYEFNNDCFIQPNTFINEKMISWVLQGIKEDKKADLLELYCGYGNFTLPLARHFNKVLATEISKENIRFALKNCELNSISNINFARLSSAELCEALEKKREFKRLKHLNLDEFDFSHILVDPPRIGLDEQVLRLASRYENIVYISCNPQSLKENLKTLSKSHKIAKFALFDQFALTPHLECGVFLRKITQ
ncbi:tRNA (uridine(54)-C5)-methyltransferase TrmA [Campylobacter sp. MIT 99-7217]|uniref:tRNA (uridine(54)-C5)-methyltransferase TrmA n=1 Tax=Campylobacter sp. MIT 99-7217 TaxID=535091 RepID=UPI0011575867|nr:tRNA (uridine(54)-C5)-methyltransferase TrmA [Campylobacter sp. MIT 99-7217]TQR34706.1 tRNA (uridine(54)-C5)-methyltransferase TrmA [Campylobacter sp. MIT 99-7217]